MVAIRSVVTFFAIVSLVFGTTASADSSDSPAHPVIEANFQGYIHFCGESGGGEIIEERRDGTVVSSGKKNVGNLWMTGNSLIDGVEENEASAEFNPKAKAGTATITGTLKPTAIDGRWSNVQHLTANEADGDSSLGIGIGEGRLIGKMIVFETGTVEMNVDSPCGPIPSVPLKGMIVSLTDD